MEQRTKLKVIGTVDGLRYADRYIRPKEGIEIIPFAKNTDYLSLATVVFPDRYATKENPLVSKVFLIYGEHLTSVGSQDLAFQMEGFLKEAFYNQDIEIMSVCSGVSDYGLQVVALVRLYRFDPSNLPNLDEIYIRLGEEKSRKRIKEGNRLVIPERAKTNYSDEEKREHKEKVRNQTRLLQKASEERPFLNSIENYTRLDMPDLNPQEELVYDLLTQDQKVANKLPYEEFIDLFQKCVKFSISVERNTYERALLEYPGAREEFDSLLDQYIQRNLVATGALPLEDLKELRFKVNRALFDLYIVQDLIDDPLVTDIKITGPNSIRCRIRGKAYLSNIHFIDEEDYMRFVWAIGLRNGIDLSLPQQTFTDKLDDRYILRFYIVSSYVSSSGLPNIEIRKIDRQKLMDERLFQAGMFDEKIRDYLRDCALHSKGAVFAGPPGSGKTVLMNWFLEQYESSAEILVIQENDELFSDRNGIMFEHIVLNPKEGEAQCTLEDLGRMALVAGANVFMIGEVKGPEILHAITLANSGCRTAITIHSESAEEVIDKMCDLSMQGNPNLSPRQAKRMMKSFETLVYIEKFKVTEIKQIVGYDEEKNTMKFRAIYKREEYE